MLNPSFFSLNYSGNVIGNVSYYFFVWILETRIRDP